MSSSNTDDNEDTAVELLQQLGLQEYEAKVYVALSRVPSATAKQISESSDVPRTRVYDAGRILEAKGLIETQHGNPQLFRAVPVEEAIATLRQQYESRFETLEAAIDDLEPRQTDPSDSVHEVWSLSGSEAIASRTQQLIDDATEELFIIVGDADLLTAELGTALREARDRGVSVIVGTDTPEVRDVAAEMVPGVEVFVSELGWLDQVFHEEQEGAEGEEVAIGRLLLGDESTILVSSVEPATGEERAVYGRGFSNGLVVIVRRMMATGFSPRNDPVEGSTDE